ncbi:hypothetical protein NUACC21_18740 [Scytonema sp. NUACC21]
MEEKDLEPATIDGTMLQSLWDMVEGDKVVFAELLNCYLEDALILVKTLSTAAKNQDAHTLHQTAHKLKSSSAYVGATLMSQLSQELEAMAKSNNLQQTTQTVQQLQKEHERVTSALRTELEKTRL